MGSGTAAEIRNSVGVPLVIYTHLVRGSIHGRGEYKSPREPLLVFLIKISNISRVKLLGLTGLFYYISLFGAFYLVCTHLVGRGVQVSFTLYSESIIFSPCTFLYAVIVNGSRNVYTLGAVSMCC